MERTAPSAGRAFFIAGIVALVFLLWVAAILAITLQIGPLAGWTQNMLPETKARVVRYSAYALVFLCCTLLFSWLAKHFLIKEVPENFAARIEVGKNRHLVTVANRVWVMPFFEKLEFINLQPRDFNFVHEAVTHDAIPIKLHVKLTWQPYAEDLQMAINANIQQEAVLKSLVQRQVTLDVNQKLLEEVQSGLSHIAFHIMRHVAYPDPFLEGARKYGIYLQEASIVELELPKELVELGKLKKISEMRKKYGPTQPGSSVG